MSEFQTKRSGTRGNRGFVRGNLRGRNLLKRLFLLLPLLTGVAGAQEKNGTLLVASIKPIQPTGCLMQPQTSPSGRWSVSCTNVKFLIQQAYGVKDYELGPLPGWAESSFYSVEALFQLTARLDKDAVQTGLQQLLADRFALKSHRVEKQSKVFALVVSDKGVKFKPHGSDSPKPPLGGMGNASGTMGMPLLARMLTLDAQMPVIDQTGLSGLFDIQLTWTPDRFRLGPSPLAESAPAPPPPPGAPNDGRVLRPMDPNGPSLGSALREQLGLRLASQTAPISVLVVDQVKPPSQN